LNLGRRVGKPATNRLSYGTAFEAAVSMAPTYQTTLCHNPEDQNLSKRDSGWQNCNSSIYASNALCKDNHNNPFNQNYNLQSVK
jgi:hypothetical protein